MADVGQAILHGYPFPIARRYEKVVGAKDEHQRWDSCRYLFEATLECVACIGIAQYLREDRSDETLNGSLSLSHEDMTLRTTLDNLSFNE